MIQTPTGVRRSSPEDLAAFDRVCERLAGFDAEISFEWVDGFLCGLAAGPRLPEPAEWLPAMFGDTWERVFADPEDAAQAQRALVLRLKVLCDQLEPGALMDDPEALRLDPLMSEWTEANRDKLVQDEGVPPEDAAMLQTGALWAEGVIDCVEAMPALWVAPEDEAWAQTYEQLLDQVAVLMAPADSEPFRQHLATYYPDRTPTRDDLIVEACYALQDLRVHWVDRAPKPETRRVEATPGRNDPCPCGSGKKYKKCHGAPGAAATQA